MDLSKLNDRLGATRIISKQYRSMLFPGSEAHGGMEWRECSFIACDRAPDGRLAHVLFTTQGIHETEARELEAQRKLQEANEELTALLAAEKQYTATIGSMSNVYFGLYYIDLARNTFQELISVAVLVIGWPLCYNTVRQT